MIKSNESKAIDRNHLTKLELDEIIIKIEKNFQQTDRDIDEKMSQIIKEQQELGKSTGFAHEYVKSPSYSKIFF